MTRVRRLLLILLLAPAAALGLPPLPTAADIKSFQCRVCSSPYFKTWRVNRQELETILGTYKIVSQRCWEHGYSHVASNDQSGIVTLKSETEIEWMVRPGGLAALTFPRGVKIHLARERSAVAGCEEH